MKIRMILLALVSLAVMLTVSGCKESTTKPDVENDYLALQKNNFWTYNVFGIDEEGNINTDFATTTTIRLGDKETLDKRTAYPLIDDSQTEVEIFSHIAADNDGVFLYMNELNLNNYITDPSITTQIPILIPGWIKVMDYEKNEWESFFVELNQVIGQDTVSGKIQITGKKQSQKQVTYKEVDYTADVVKISIDLYAKDLSPTGGIERSAKSDIIYTFIKGIGIYSIQENANEILGIPDSRIEVLTDHGIAIPN